MTKQTERLLDWLKTGKTINPLTSWRALGIYRLGARIFDLKEEGHTIEREIVKVYNSWGEPCRVAEYRLITSADASPQETQTKAGELVEA